MARADVSRENALSTWRAMIGSQRQIVRPRRLGRTTANDDDPSKINTQRAPLPLPSNPMDPHNADKVSIR